MFVYARIALACAFKAQGVDQPTGGDFYRTVRLGVVGQVGVAPLQGLKSPFRKDWVFKKTTAVPQDRWVGQFALPNGDDRLGNALWLGGVSPKAGYGTIAGR